MLSQIQHTAATKARWDDFGTVGKLSGARFYLRLNQTYLRMQLPFKIQLKTAPWESLGDRLVCKEGSGLAMPSFPFSSGLARSCLP